MRPKDLNFIEWYLRAAGRSEVPPTYHIWSCISLITMCMTNKVWLEKWSGSKMYPNLFVFLIGPPANGKDTAINMAYDIALEVPGLLLKRAKLTGPAMADLFGRKVEASIYDSGESSGQGSAVSGERQPHICLITPELSQSVGEGSVASDFIKRMTAYFGGEPYEMDEGTRTMQGRIQFVQPTIHWLAGTTMPWMMESVPRSAIEGGFLSRICCSYAGYSLDNRVARPEFPKERDAIIKWLIHRCREIVQLEGRFELTNQAKDLQQHWYETRPSPEDEALIPTWKRADDLIYKIAMAMSVARGRNDLKITAKCWDDARRLWQQSFKIVPELIRKASLNIASSQLDIVADYIRSAGLIPRQSLTKKCSQRGIRAADLDTHIRTLLTQGDIKVAKLGRGIGYEWVRSAGLLKTVREGSKAAASADAADAAADAAKE